MLESNIEASAATTYTSGNYEYTVSNGKATITAYTGSAKSLTIPSTLGGYTVASIGNDAFFECTSLTSITIPDSVTSIGDAAFSYCNSLTVKCYKGSYAQKYCKNNSINYELLDYKVTAKSAYTSSTSKVKISWKKVSGASGYRIYRYNSSTKKWVKIKTIKSGSTTSYKDTGLSSGKTYKYKVKAYVKSSSTTYWGVASSTITTSTKPAKVTIKSASKSKTAVHLNWKKVTGASGYKIQQYNASTKKWTTIKTIRSGSTLTYRISGLKRGTVYKYRIRAYRKVNGKTLFGAYSATKKVTTKS